ncbi:Uncharacterised protein [Helicobacter fennelliae]|nr:Uncharacterised protein [Helicobacter fennelliae]
MHYQATIPDNVIRIETLDESDEFIEIILPEEQEENNTNDIEQENDWLDTAKDLALDLGLAVISRGRYKPKNRTNKVNKGATNFNRSLTREEVLEVVDKLPNGLKSNGDINERVKLVKSKKELESGIDKRHGKPIYRRQLDDGTNINYRVDSKTGGETIDINNRNPKLNIKIHIDKGV